MSMRQFVIQAIKFQSTPSVGRATIFLCISLYRSVISIHALRGEGDTAGFISQTSRSHFNPRPPWGGRQIDYKDLGHYSIISIHALRGEGDAEAMTALGAWNISIHALRGEGDSFGSFCFHPLRRISIHALRGEGDFLLLTLALSKSYFNPRPPWGGRPQRDNNLRSIRRNFNPRPPWGGRPLDLFIINTLTLGFQSTPSVGRATIFSRMIKLLILISIHALRGEGDKERKPNNTIAPKFQSTPSVGRATMRCFYGKIA